MRNPDEWMNEGKCVGMDTNVFYPDEAGAPGWTTEAKSICARCKVKSKCFEYALANHEVGVWGGTDDIERRKIRRSRGLSAIYRRNVQPCGTEAAYFRHRSHGEPPCDACVEARNVARMAKRAAAK